MATPTERIILGIDPGTTLMGYGIISATTRDMKLLAMGVVELNKLKDPYKKLQYIFERTLHLVDHYHPDELAIEAPFFGKNVQSMLKLGRAQGVAIAAALYRQLPIFEYAPRKIKQSITGQGEASKEQVAGFLKNILGFEDIPKNLDATDGLAAAVCHYYQRSAPTAKTTGNSWADFIRNNPGKIIG